MGNIKVRNSTGISFGASAFYYLYKWYAKAHQPFKNVVLFADDTSIFNYRKNYENLNQKISLTLDCTSRCFKANQLVLNFMKINIIKFSPSHLLQSQMINEHINTYISEVPDTKFTGVQTDNHLYWKCHIDQILPKLSIAAFVIGQLFYVINLKTLWMPYFAYFHSIIRYGIIFWGNATNSFKVFKLQKRIIKIIWSRTKSIL
jgi:hypothetical protein